MYTTLGEQDNSEILCHKKDASIDEGMTVTGAIKGIFTIIP